MALYLIDVITAGTACCEALINASGGKVTAVVITLDRYERGESNQSTLAEIQQQDIRVLSIITLQKSNFYVYANGSWQKQNPIPKEYSSWNNFHSYKIKIRNKYVN